MAYDPMTAVRLREAVRARRGVAEIAMMGGLCFTLNGNMFCGVIKDDLVVRVGPLRHDEALSRPHARPMDFTGRPIRGFVFVGPRGHRARRDMERWVALAVDYVAALPPKKKGRKR